MVLIVDDDDNHDIWDVFEPDQVEWKWAGLNQSGSRGILTVAGSFKRRHTSAKSREIGERMRRMLERGDGE